MVWCYISFEITRFSSLAPFIQIDILLIKKQSTGPLFKKFMDKCIHVTLNRTKTDNSNTKVSLKIMLFFFFWSSAIRCFSSQLKISQLKFKIPQERLWENFNAQSNYILDFYTGCLRSLFAISHFYAKRKWTDIGMGSRSKYQEHIVSL